MAKANWGEYRHANGEDVVTYKVELERFVNDTLLRKPSCLPL